MDGPRGDGRAESEPSRFSRLSAFISICISTPTPAGTGVFVTFVTDVTSLSSGWSSERVGRRPVWVVVFVVVFAACFLTLTVSTGCITTVESTLAPSAAPYTTH